MLEPPRPALNDCLPGRSPNHPSAHANRLDHVCRAQAPSADVPPRLTLPQIPGGVTLAAMQCALKGHAAGRHEAANCREIFEEFDVENSGDLTPEELQKVCATLGNLLGKEGIDDLYAELDEDGDGTVSLEEFENWWERDVAPNQAINSRVKRLRCASQLQASLYRQFQQPVAPAGWAPAAAAPVRCS